MDVFEDEHRRLFARRSFDEAASREEERLAVRDGSGGVQAEQDARCSVTTGASAGSRLPATVARSFSSATSTGSLSKMWQNCLSCVANAQYALLSRYGNERPRTIRPPSSSARSMNSTASRDFPTPAGPKTVTS